MTDAELRRRLTDLPENARSWTSDRWAREAAGAGIWYVFMPGEVVRCPDCSTGLTEFGSGQGCAIRIHPEQRRDPATHQPAGPTSAHGEARVCPSSRCRKHLDMRFLPIAKVVEASPRS